MNINTTLPNGVTILSLTDPYVLPSGQKNMAYLCRCHCGNIFKARKLHLIRGKTNSCGCSKLRSNGRIDYLSVDKAIRTLWCAIRYRCGEKHVNKNVYYDRGITMCKEWLEDYKKFEKWCLENGYNKNLEIDRIDNNLGYSPTNCRFVTAIQNARNKQNSKIITYKGLKMHINDFIEQGYTKVKYGTIIYRLNRGWSIEDCFEIDSKLGNKIYKNGVKNK